VENLLIALSYYVPDNMTLYNLNVDRENDNTTELVGRVRGTGIADSDAIFNNFYNRIKSSGLFSEVAEPLLSSTIENEVYILEFKIDCKLNV